MPRDLQRHLEPPLAELLLAVAGEYFFLFPTFFPPAAAGRSLGVLAGAGPLAAVAAALAAVGTGGAKGSGRSGEGDGRHDMRHDMQHGCVFRADYVWHESTCECKTLSLTHTHPLSVSL